MKSEMRILLCGLVLQAGLSLCLAHDNVTMHPKISESAARSSSGLNNFLSGCFALTNLDQPKIPFGEYRLFGTNGTMGPLEWLKTGSIFEDSPFWRGFNHFYDPVHNKIGLTDGYDNWAKSSFEWATEDLSQTWQQSFPWKLVRTYELNALTNSSKAGRETNLAGMMCYLGHVIHLNQDLTVPAHVRNDNHGLTLQHGVRETFIMWTEIYGAKSYSTQEVTKVFPLRPHGWPWWQGEAKFQKLEDFWNRGLLITNKANALNSDAGNEAGKELGLSEFCNGNFISEDAMYGEFFANHGAKHYFQYPSLETSTIFPQIRANPANYVKPYTLANGVISNHVVIQKPYDGIYVTNHSVLNYLGAKFPTTHLKRKTTIHDDNVLQEYHEKLIPKAIEYSAGILDYFFRGTMDVSLNLDTNIGPYTVTNLNTSGQDFYGGAFYLFQETNGVRTLVQSNDWSGKTLSMGSSMTMTFSDPPPPGARFFSVYQGTIGITNGTDPLDPVDANIGVAVGRPWIEQVKTYHYQPYLDELHLQAGATITTNLESDDFDFTPTPGNYEVKVNYALFDDTGTIGGVVPTEGSSYCSTWHNEIHNTIIPAGQVTVIGNHLRVPITATDDPNCGQHVGWWTITLTWRAWPSP